MWVEALQPTDISKSKWHPEEVSLERDFLMLYSFPAIHSVLCFTAPFMHQTCNHLSEIKAIKSIKEFGLWINAWHAADTAFPNIMHCSHKWWNEPWQIETCSLSACQMGLGFSVATHTEKRVLGPSDLLGAVVAVKSLKKLVCKRHWSSLGIYNEIQKCIRKMFLWFQVHALTFWNLDPRLCTGSPKYIIITWLE